MNMILKDTLKEIVLAQQRELEFPLGVLREKKLSL